MRFNTTVACDWCGEYIEEQERRLAWDWYVCQTCFNELEEDAQPMAYDNCTVCDDGETIEKLQATIRTLKKERDAAIKRFETYAVNDAQWGVENSIFREALEEIARERLSGDTTQRIAQTALDEATCKR
jgi:hypothetical protein